MRLEEIHSGETLHEVLELAYGLKHDIGKYITMQRRWMAPEHSFDDRVSALRADILETRRSGDSVSSAVEVWREFEPRLCGKEAIYGDVYVRLSDDPDISIIRVNMATLADVIAPLTTGQITEEQVTSGEQLADDIAQACRSFYRRALSRKDQET